MKLGINNDVNSGTKKAALQLMEGGQSKINTPNSHPSNPIHKAAMAAQSPWPDLKKKKKKFQKNRQIKKLFQKDRRMKKKLFRKKSCSTK